MNTSLQQKPVFINSIIFTLSLCAVAATTPVRAQQQDALDSQTSWQNNRLFAPTAHQRQQEKRGSVVIYDGLKDTTIDKAMDKAFDRIQNMMFVRIIRTSTDGQPKHQKNGQVMVEDDGC